MQTYNKLALILWMMIVSMASFADDDFQKSFEAFAKDNQNSMQGFVNNLDQEFVQMLEQNWAEFQAMPPLKRDKAPKPKVAPRYTPHINETHKKQSALVEEIPFVAIEKLSTSTEVLHGLGIFDFYGHTINLPTIEVSPVKSVSQESLSRFWLAQSEFDNVGIIEQLTSLKHKLALSDWACWQLIQGYLSSLNLASNERQAMAWFLLTKLGYKVKVAYDSDDIVLLAAFEQTAYEMTYFVINGVRYYQINGHKLKGVKTYHGEYSDNNEALNLAFDKTLKTKIEPRARHISYHWDNENIELSIPYDVQRVQYLRTIPQLDLEFYFRAPIDGITLNAFKQQLLPKLKGSQEQNINHLLSLIHQAFPYAIDELQFGEENYLLFEETLHYQASDCEDRSILFAGLVKHLLKTQVIGLDYPGHIAAGVVIKGAYQVADPTFIGAALGDVMPNYLKTIPVQIIF